MSVLSCSSSPCVILAGGFGTRLGDITDSIPKPMVEIGGKPILWHIISHYMKFGVSEFIVALGYKSQYIKKYFLDLKYLLNDFTLNIETGKASLNEKNLMTYPKITFVDTGVSTSTGTRLNRLKPLLSQYDIFMLTYGDGISDVDIEQLYNYHCSHSCAATVTAVRPPARFGELQLEGNSVVGFQEKPSISTGRINGGFFVFNKTFFQYIPDHDVMLERDPLENAIRSNDLKAFIHDGFWQCMDTRRDLDFLNKLYTSKGGTFY